MDRVKLESAIGQIVATFKDVEEPVNVLRELSNVSMLLCETEKLRALIHKDVHGLFEKDEETKELEESARDLCARLRVCSMETVKTPEGYTGIDAVVEVAPPARKASKKDAVKRKGKGGKGQEEKEESTMFHFKFRREQVGSKEMYDVKPLPTDEEEEEEGEEEMKAKEKGAAKGAKAAGAAKSKAAEKEEEEDEEEGESDGESEEPPPKVMVNYTISAVKGHGRPEPLLEMNILSLYLAPSNAGVLPVGEEDEEADEDDEEREVPDRAMVGVDEEGLARAVEWIGMDGQLDAPRLLVLLMSFPFHEEEWDVTGVVLDIVLPDDEESGDEEEGEEEEEEEKEEKEEKACGKKRCGCHHTHEQEEEEEGEEEMKVEKQGQGKKGGAKRAKTRK